MPNSFPISTPGRVATQPTLKYGEEARPRVHFRLAVDDNTRGPDGEWVKRQTVFHDVVAFGKSAERYAAALQVGDPVVVAGDLRFSTYYKDGEDRTASQVVASAIGPDLRMCDVTIDRSRRGTGPDQTPAVTGPTATAPDQPAPLGASNKIKEPPAQQDQPQPAGNTHPVGPASAAQAVASPRWPSQLGRPVSDLPAL